MEIPRLERRHYIYLNERLENGGAAEVARAVIEAVLDVPEEFREATTLHDCCEDGWHIFWLSLESDADYGARIPGVILSGLFENHRLKLRYKSSAEVEIRQLESRIATLRRLNEGR